MALISASFGLHAAFTLTDRTLRRCVEANQSLHAGFHVHVAEDRMRFREACRGGYARPGSWMNGRLRRIVST